MGGVDGTSAWWDVKGEAEGDAQVSGWGTLMDGPSHGDGALAKGRFGGEHGAPGMSFLFSSAPTWF